MRQKWKKYLPDGVIAVYLLGTLLLGHIPENVYGYIYAYYVLDYSYGFGSRLMIGSILHLFTGSFVPHHIARVFVIVALCVLCILLAHVIGSCIRSVTDHDTRMGLLFLVILYLAGPAGPGYLWTDENLGRLDTYLFILALVLIVIAFRIRTRLLRFFLYTLIAVLAITVHQAYVFLFLPSLLVILINEVFDTGGGEYKKRIIPAFAVLCVICIAFLWMQFRSGIYYDTTEQLVAELETHTDGYISDAAMEAEYFWEIRDHVVRNQLPELRTRVRFGIITAVILSPVWGFYTFLWVRAIRHAGQNRHIRFKYILIALTNLCYVPIFTLMTDWGRWWAALFTVQLLNSLVLLYHGDKEITQGVAMIGRGVRKYTVVYGALVLYAANFDKFEAARYLPQAMNLYEHLYAFIRLLS